VNAIENNGATLPGEELVEQGLRDLATGRITENALLVLIASPRLEKLGVSIPTVSVAEPYEHRLYDLLSERFGNAAHSHYNSLIRRIVSYTHALSREHSAQQQG
jgi:hypothetical protein